MGTLGTSAPVPDVRPARAQVVRRHPLASFTALAFAISWLPWPLHAATGEGPVILGCGPAIAAAIVLAITTGSRGIRYLGRSMVRWRVPLRWWAVALGLPVACTLLAAGANVALGAPAPSASDLAAGGSVLPVALLFLLVPVFGGAWEEPGWRGYALPRLLRTSSPLVAALAVGAIWAAWHVPVLASGEQEWSDLLLVVEVSVVLTWLFTNALGSVLVAMVFHALNNAVSGEWVSQWFEGGDAVRQGWLLVLVWGLLAALVAALAPGFRAGRLT